MRTDATLGILDLFNYLERKKGTIKFQLIDAGMVRPIEANYEYRLIEDNKVSIKRIGNKGKNIEINAPRFINLTPNFLVFIGMYDGDGNKTNNIGFAQNEQHLQNFVMENLKIIFGDSFQEEITILEDTQYFEGNEIKNRVVALKQKNLDLEEKDIYKQILKEEFKHRFGVEPPEYVKYVISPLKGARKAGQSSYEIIRNLKNSKNFLPLFLCFIKDIIKTVYDNEQYLNNDKKSGISWIGKPKECHKLSVNIKKFIESEVVYMGINSPNRYKLISESDQLIELMKSGGSQFKVYRYVKLTPLLCIMFGLYWAEGTTNKSKFFTFKYNTENLVLGFNSSEEITLNLFIEGISSIFPNFQDVFSYWLIKIGTKYFAETNALSFKIGVPCYRGGNLGQGISRSIEISEELKTWGIHQSSDMKKLSKYYRHIEFTGNGIPRIDLRCKSAVAPLLFSLMRDLSFGKEKIEEVLLDESQ